MAKTLGLSVVPDHAPSALAMAEVETLQPGQFGFVGLFDMFMSHVLQTEEDEHILLGAAVIAAAIGRQLQSQLLHGTYYPNLWVLLLAPSGAGKTTQMRQAQSLLALTMADRLLPGSSTPESLQDHLRDLTPDQLAERRKQGIPAYLGEGIIIRDEYSRHLRMMQSPTYMANAAEQLIELYDGSTVVQSTRAGGVVRISQPCLSMVAATTHARFNEVVKPELSSGGYLARHIFQELGARTRRAISMADAVAVGDRPRLGQELAELRRMCSRAIVACQWGESVSQRLLAYELFLEREKEAEARAEDMDPYYQRYPEHVIKLAMILSYASRISDGSVSAQACAITMPALLKAIQVTERSRAASRTAIEGLTASPMVREAARLVRWLQSHGGTASQRDVMRNLHWDADTARRVRQTAESRGDITPIKATNDPWELVSA